jgi:myosin heavy subunit
MLSIVKIQKMIRGYLTRKFVARWFHVRNRVIVEIQARTRKYLSNIRLRPIQRYQMAMATRIQKIIRGFLGRKRYHFIERTQAAIRIQSMWRGVVDRGLSDKKWLNLQVIRIQNSMRKKIAMNRFHFFSYRYNTAAIKIQRRFRTYLAGVKIANLLYEREMRYRLNVIKVLSNEEELCQEKILKLMTRVVRQGIKEATTQALLILTKLEEEIMKKENDYIELIRQREILSPRAIEQGFFEDLTKNMAISRDEIAALKFKYLFEDTINLHAKERIFENQVAELEEFAANRNRVAKWRVDVSDFSFSPDLLLHDIVYSYFLSLPLLCLCPCFCPCFLCLWRCAFDLRRCDVF